MSKYGKYRGVEKKEDGSMRYTLKDWLWTSKSISEELGKNNSEWFTKKFGYILDKLDVPQKYFKTKREKGQFIFSNKEAPEKINEIFTIFDKDKGYMTFQEKEIVINNLVEILPVCSSSEEIEQLIKETEEMRKNTKIDTSVRLEFDESDLHDYRNDADYVISKSVEQYYLNIIVEEDFVFRKKIYFEVNVSLVTSVNYRKQIYGYQYKLIKKWSDKWEFIMNEVKKLRIAERFDLLYQVSKIKNINSVCQNEKSVCEVLESVEPQARIEKWGTEDIQKLWITTSDLCDFCVNKYDNEEKDKKGNNNERDKKENNKEKDKKGGDEEDSDDSIEDNGIEPISAEDCKKKYKNLVDSIVGIDLRYVSLKDYDYLIKEAFKELEDIHDKVEIWQEKTMYNISTNEGMDDLELLKDIRNSVDAKKINVFHDYKG